MKRIAFLGCENSHADTFLKIMKEYPEFADVEAVGVYSEDVEAAKKLSEKYGIPVLNDFGDALGRVDGVMVTARHGQKHLQYARAYLKNGVSAFIDKPITITEQDAMELVTLAKTHGAGLVGGSSCRLDACVKRFKKDHETDEGGKTIGGFVRAPIDLNNNYGGFYFYAQHLVEIVGEIYGKKPLSVYAKRNGRTIHVLFGYADYDITGVFTDRSYQYYVSRFTDSASMSDSFSPGGDNPCFYEEFQEFYNLVSGNGGVSAWDDFIAPVFVMNAIVRSMESGKEEKICYREVE